jgi:hypothetical protein
MTDPRNIAHDKKVQQEKKHRHEEVAPGAAHTVQPGKKPQMTVRPETPATDDAVEQADKDDKDEKAGSDGKAAAQP